MLLHKNKYFLVILYNRNSKRTTSRTKKSKVLVKTHESYIET